MIYKIQNSIKMYVTYVYLQFVCSGDTNHIHTLTSYCQILQMIKTTCDTFYFETFFMIKIDDSTSRRPEFGSQHPGRAAHDH